MLQAFYPISLALSGSIGYSKNFLCKRPLDACNSIVIPKLQLTLANAVRCSQMFRYPLVLLFNQCVTVLHDVWLILSQLQD